MSGSVTQVWGLLLAADQVILWEVSATVLGLSAGKFLLLFVLFLLWCFVFQSFV